MITGIGFVSSQGEGGEAHWSALGSRDGAQPVVDATRFAPYSVHPLVELDFSKQIPRKGDQRQMEPWQRIGVYTAGLALADAGIAGEPELLERTHMIVAAGSGERDTAMDTMLLENSTDADGSKLSPNEVLRTELRPTLFLAQLSNLLAGNISIIHKVTASSRTFMGEEMAGLSAVEVAAKRIASGQGDLFLVGGAYNAEREDLLLILELGRNLYGDDFASVWNRNQGRHRWRYDPRQRRRLPHFGIPRPRAGSWRPRLCPVIRYHHRSLFSQAGTVAKNGRRAVRATGR